MDVSSWVQNWGELTLYPEYLLVLFPVSHWLIREKYVPERAVDW